MNRSIAIAILAVLGALPVATAAEEAQAGVYLVDPSVLNPETKGQWAPYSPSIAISPDRKLILKTKAPAGATVLAIAFEGDSLFRSLKPILTTFEAESPAITFPDSSSGKSWSFAEENPTVSLYVAVFSQGDPQLERLEEYVGWLTDSIDENKTDEAALHALAIKNRLSNIVRTKGSQDYRARFEGSLTQTTPTEPTGKAAVTRGGTVKKTPLPDPQDLATLAETWKDSCETIPFSADTPGILVFDITAR